MYVPLSLFHLSPSHSNPRGNGASAERRTPAVSAVCYTLEHHQQQPKKKNGSSANARRLRTRTHTHAYTRDIRGERAGVEEKKRAKGEEIPLSEEFKRARRRWPPSLLRHSAVRCRRRARARKRRRYRYQALRMSERDGAHLYTSRSLALSLCIHVPISTLYTLSCSRMITICMYIHTYVRVRIRCQKEVVRIMYLQRITMALLWAASKKREKKRCPNESRACSKQKKRSVQHGTGARNDGHCHRRRHRRHHRRAATKAFAGGRVCVRIY